jgi:hypothetical protein
MVCLAVHRIVTQLHVTQDRYLPEPLVLCATYDMMTAVEAEAGLQSVEL